MSLKPWVDALRNPPIQYQKGWTEFYKLKFKLTPDVLIPRPETEILVDEVISICHPRPDRGSINNDLLLDSRLRGNDKVTIIDVGTGSGAIAVSVAKNLPNAKVFALDISEKALKVAEGNAEFHKVSNKVLFIKSDLLSVISSVRDKSDGKSDSATLSQNDKNVDIIVSNLPYIPTAKLLLIDPMVRDFEPMLALDGGSDGFDLYRKLFGQIKESKLFPKYLIAEIDEDQADLARQEVKRYFPESSFEIKKDLAKKDRILVVKFS